MTYLDPIAAEATWNSESGRPGKPTILRSHYAYRQGVRDYHDGKTACTYLKGGEAERHWHAGQRDAAQSSGVGLTTN